MNFSALLQRCAFAVYAADATILTLLVHENVISNQTALDVAALITALAAGFHGKQAVDAIKANGAQNETTQAGNRKDTGTTI